MLYLYDASVLVRESLLEEKEDRESQKRGLYSRDRSTSRLGVTPLQEAP